jgi:hypothetical protein
MGTWEVFLMLNNEPAQGNIGVITTLGQELYEVTGLQNGLVYCLPIEGPKVCKVCTPSNFWVLLDAMP